MAKLLVRLTVHIRFASTVKRVYDNRLGVEPKPFVRIMLSNGSNLDIPTDCGEQMLALANAVSAVRDNIELTLAVANVISDYLVDNRTIGVQTGIKAKTFRLLADDDCLSKPGQSGLEREVIVSEVVTL